MSLRLAGDATRPQQARVGLQISASSAIATGVGRGTTSVSSLDGVIGVIVGLPTLVGVVLLSAGC